MHCTFMSLITVSSLYFLSTKRPRKSENIDGALRNSRLWSEKYFPTSLYNVRLLGCLDQPPPPPQTNERGNWWYSIYSNNYHHSFQIWKKYKLSLQDILSTNENPVQTAQISISIIRWCNLMRYHSMSEGFKYY